MRVLLKESIDDSGALIDTQCSSLGKYDCAFVDLDGTLFRDKIYDLFALNEISRTLKSKFGLLLPNLAISFLSQKSRSKKNIFNKILHGYPDNLINEVISMYQNYRCDIDVNCKKTMLADLRYEVIFRLLPSVKYKILITNGHYNRQANKINALNLRSRFDRCIICDPDSDNYLKPLTQVQDYVVESNCSCPVVVGNELYVDGLLAFFNGYHYLHVELD